MINFLKPKSETEPSAKVGFSFVKAINFCLYLLVFATPLLFSSLTFEFREFNKQALIFSVVLIALGFWLIKNLTTRKFSWVRTSLDFVLLIYLGIYFIASLTSIDRTSSFLGYYGRFTGSFMSVLGFILLYFLVVNNVRTAKVMRVIVDCLTISSGLVLIYSLLQLLGKYILPFSFAKTQSFNPIGSLAALAIFSAVCIIYYLWMLLNNRNRMKNWAIGFLILIGIIVLLLINSFIAWLTLALGLIAFVAITMSVTDAEVFQVWFWKPMLVLVVAVLFVSFQFLPQVLNPRTLIKLDLPTEIQLSSKATWGLVKGSLDGGMKNVVLGTGPGTLGIGFGNIKPTELNKTIVWSVNFDRASTEIANKTIETGILGTLVFELVAVMFIIYALQYLFRKAGHKGYYYALGFFGLWLPLYISHFFYFFNVTFDFLFWLSLALFMAVTNWSSEEEPQVSHSPKVALTGMFITLIALAGVLLGLFWQATIWAGDAAYAAGIVKLKEAQPDYAAVSQDFSNAKDLNPYRDVYYLAYGQSLYFQASQEAAKKPADWNQIRNWVSTMIAAVQKATEISPNKASNWSAVAQFYTGIRSLASGTDKYILDAWQQAINHDSKNPVLYSQKAQALINSSVTIDSKIAGTGKDTDSDGLSDEMETKFGSDPKKFDTNGDGLSDGDDVKAGLDPVNAGALSDEVLAPYKNIDTEKLKQAEDALHTAIDLKADLPDPYIQLSRLLEQTNRQAEAKTQLDLAASIFPNNPDILFEQGKVTYNQQKFDEAEKIFNEVLTISPNHANALFSLSLIAEIRGDLANALTLSERVRTITGPNVDLEKRITDLKAKISAEPKK